MQKFSQWRTHVQVPKASPMRSPHFQLLHHHLWRRIPQTWRRSLLFHATALMAPRLPAGLRPSAPLVVVGAMGTASGLGESARLCYDALRLSGIPACGIDISAGLMQPADAPDYSLDDAAGNILEGPGTLILHVNSPLVPLALMSVGRRLVKDKYIVGYWAWELPNLPADWHHGMPFVHEIWTPSRFTAEAIKPFAAGRQVRVVPHPVARRQLEPHPAIDTIDRPFTVLIIFDAASSFARKNPSAAIEAFRLAFGDDSSTQLIIKALHLSSFPSGQRLIEDARQSANNIIVIEKAMNASELAALYAKTDVVISLHRSEGFGLVLAEAMLRGLPVVATNWSGNTDFLNGDVGMPIGYRLVPAEDPQATYHHPEMQWAEANIKEAAAALQLLRAAPELRSRLGQAASRFALSTWSVEAYTSAVERHLGLGRKPNA